MSTTSPYGVNPGMQPPPEAKNNTLKIVLIVLGGVFLGVLLCAGLLAILLMPAINAARDAAQQMSTQNNMKMIALALHNYHDSHRQFPPLYVTDADGNPASSWRVSLLLYLEEGAVADRWQDGQPWNAPANQSLLEQTPSVYRATGEVPIGPHDGECHVFAIDDPRALLSGDEPRRFRDVLDGTSNTLFALYLPHRSVPWSAPQELTFDEAFQEVSAASREAPVFVLMCDGSVRRLDMPLSEDEFTALVTRDGGEPAFMF